MIRGDVTRSSSPLHVFFQHQSSTLPSSFRLQPIVVALVSHVFSTLQRPTQTFSGYYPEYHLSSPRDRFLLILSPHIHQRKTSALNSTVLTGYLSSNCSSTLGCTIPNTPMILVVVVFLLLLSVSCRWMDAAWAGKKVGSLHTGQSLHDGNSEWQWEGKERTKW